ncbi:MAG: substrate-binding domain-containing protein, partial [Phycisphaeraceae bacterium]|nr:substrate-binding domain-containing protein [Phycisphaeraceae bacterium]
MMRQRRVDGLILSPHHHNRDFYIQLRDAGVKMVFVDTRYEDLDIPYVCSDDFVGGRLVGEHLASCGCRCAAILRPRPVTKYDSLAPRCDGCKQALQEAGVQVVEDWVERSIDGTDNQPQVIRRLLARTRFDALMTATDMNAFNAIDTLRSEGLRVPQDVAIAGYGNLKESDYVVPGLTSVDQHTEEIGRAAVQLLLAQLNDSDAPPPAPVKTTPHLVPRQSTATKTPSPAESAPA